MKKIKLKKDVTIEVLDEKLIALSIDKGIFFEINEAGHQIIKLINLGEDYEKIVEAFKKKYKITHVEAKSDIDKFLKQLEEKSII